MNKSEFILLIPGIIYGVALVDLLKIFRHKNTYWEVTGWGVIMIINLIVSWFSLYDKLEVISGNILLFTVYLVSPLLFAQAVFVLTPEEEDTDTKAYFMKTNRLFFILLLGLIVVNQTLLFFLAEDSAFMIMRTIIAFPFIAIIIWQKKWMRQMALLLYYSFGIYIYIQSVL
jgi:hypothetical protein